MFNNNTFVNNINGDYFMKNNNYHLFLFLITFTRGIIETFSLVLLYKKGFSLKEILFFLTLMYTFGIIVNYISLKINYKIMLIISSLLYGISYLYLSSITTKLISLSIFALLLSFCTYSYHSLRHLLALTLKIKNTTLVINIMFLANIIASIAGIYIVSKLSIFSVSIILFIFSIISLIPIFKIDIKITKEKRKLSIPKQKIIFNILEQFKVIFLELQPLFLYIYINESVSFVGGFNIIINISSLIVLLFLRKISIINNYIYICLLLGIILLFKISISNAIILFLIAIIEGILIKLYERGSLTNLYDINNNPIKEYLILEEFIFFITKSIIMLLFLLLDIKLKSILLICIIGIIISGLVFNLKPQTQELIQN